MKKVLVLFGCVFLGVMAWKIGEKISSEVFALIIGVLLGILAGIPTGLMVLASGRRKESIDRSYPIQQQPQYPPMIFMGGTEGGSQPPMQQQQPALPVKLTQNRGEIEHANW
jgi:hypothetical protein